MKKLFLYNPPPYFDRLSTGCASAPPFKGETAWFPLPKGVAQTWSLRNILSRGIFFNKATFSLFTVLLFILSGCTPDVENPFDDPNNFPPDDTTGIENIDPASFVGLHQNIFKPTCANSGCHDGTFEPDFRTIESSYNTLVFHDVVKNNPAGTYEYRVKPE
ncbi:MAG: hypothetical protein ACPG5W_05290, partial [Flavobacteriales bacterium]